MDIGTWKARYIKRLIDQYGFTKELAEDTFNASENSGHDTVMDYFDDPEGAADEEMSYWGD